MTADSDQEAPLDFYLTPPHPCSYLDRSDAQTLFADPRRIITSTAYQQLSAQGFRRSGGHLYRPRCNHCNACIAVRIPISGFRPTRAQRRTSKRNQDLTVQIEPARFTPRHYQVYERYISMRHTDGDMYPASEDQFKSFLLCAWADTQFVCLYRGEQLLSVAVTDQLDDGLSAVYTFLSLLKAAEVWVSSVFCSKLNNANARGCHTSTWATGSKSRQKWRIKANIDRYRCLSKVAG